MARTGDDVNPERRSSGSQFYICLDDVHRLDGKYTVWANVSEGMDVVLNLRAGDTIERVGIRKTGHAFDDDIESALAELELKATDPVTGCKYDDLKAVVKTSKGAFEIAFHYNGAPEHVISFVKLTHDGFYENIKFTRYEPGRLIQTGVPSDDETGEITESVPFEFHPDYKHLERAVGMAAVQSDGEEKYSNPVELYICLGEIPELNGEQAIFGKIISGWEIVLALMDGDIIESIQIVHSAESRATGK
jgi:peptidyl-prolyl cis-trans isomerase B (cyclophilin B)